MPDLDSVKNQIVAEWRVIKDAPLTIAAAFVVISLGAWRVVSWADSTTISGKDATIETLKTQNDAYKDKLSGASPDEAKARIDTLEARLAKLEPRRIPSDKLNIMSAILKNVSQGEHNIAIEADISCTDCIPSFFIRRRRSEPRLCFE